MKRKLKITFCLLVLVLLPLLSPKAPVSAQSPLPLLSDRSPSDEADTEQSSQLQASVSVVLQRGLEGYDGVSDTFLKDESPAIAYGSDPVMHVKEAAPIRRGLIRFDLSHLAGQIDIDSVQARLEMNVHYLYPDTSITVSVHRLLRSWDEASADWANASTGTPWAFSGTGAGYDYETTPAAQWQISAGAGAYKGLDVSEVVKGWLREPGTNYGLILLGSSSVDLRFWSSDAASDAWRPRLLLTYNESTEPTATATLTPTATPSSTATQTLIPGVTPSSTATPTTGFSVTPTATATNTPYVGPTVVVESISFDVVDPSLYNPEDQGQKFCVEASLETPGNRGVLLIYEGEPSEAELSFSYSSTNNSAQQVSVNGTPIGQLPVYPGGGEGWGPACNIDLATLCVIPFDPSILHSGINTITIYSDGNCGTDQSWAMQQAKITISGDISGSTFHVVEDIESSYDQTMQRAMVQEPIGYDPVLSDTIPMVVALHGWGGPDYDAIVWMAQAASDFGWLLLCPDVRHRTSHTPILRSQADILDAINWAKSEYDVDEDRVYLLGTSMGGMMASTFACRYPHLFAALVELRGATDVEDWYYEAPSRQESFVYDIGSTPGIDPFTYARISSARMPMNLSNLPTVIVHGLQDSTIMYHHATDLKAGIDAWDPVYCELYPYDGGHEAGHPDWEPHDILTFFEPYERNLNPTRVAVRADSQKDYYWLSIAYDYYYAVEDHWVYVDARYDDHSDTILAEVRDDRSVPIPLNIAFDLVQMGLPTGVTYTVEQLNHETGAYEQFTLYAGTTLVLNVPAAHHSYTIYPDQGEQVYSVALTQGEAGYAGVTDTYINGYATGEVNGAETSLRVTDGGSRKPLIRFDLSSSLPSGIVIKGAQLSIHAGSKWNGEDNTFLDIHRVLSDWDVAAASWNDRMTGVPWYEAGAQADGIDYDSSVVASQEVRNAPEWYQYNVTELVGDWVEDPVGNFGMLLKGHDGRGTIIFNSSESTSDRPELNIQYAFPTETPLPSPTPTTTPMPTATATATPDLTLIYLPALLKTD